MATPASSSPGKLVLQSNVPELIALKYPTGKIVTSNFGDEKQVFYTLVDGRSAYFSLGVANSITNLMLGTREPFYVCKRGEGKKVQYDVWLTPEGEKIRAELEAAPPVTARVPAPVPAPKPAGADRSLEEQLLASLDQIRQRRDGLPPAPRPVAVPDRAPAPAAPAWSASLLETTNALIDVYSQAVAHAEELGVPSAIVRAVMISAYIGIQKNGGARG